MSQKHVGLVKFYTKLRKLDLIYRNPVRRKALIIFPESHIKDFRLRN